MRRWRLILLLLLVALFTAHAFYATSGALVDDAYIVVRYSKNLAAGLGLRFQPGEPPVEGYTCFTWVVLGAVFARLGLEPAVLLPISGTLCGAATIAVVYRASGRVWGAATRRPPPPHAGLLPAAFLAMSPGLAYFAGSGLETALFCLLVVLAFAGAVEGRPVLAGVATSLALLTRPEGAVVALLVTVVGVVRAPRERRRSWLASAAAVLAIAGAYAAFKWAYFGSLLPNTLAAKPPDLREGLAYTGWALVDPGPLLALTIAVVASRSRRGLGPDAWALACAAALVAVSIAEGGDWMGAGRFVLPALCIASFAFDAPVRAIVQSERGAARGAIGVIGALAFAFYGYWSRVDTGRMRHKSLDAAHYEPFRDDLARRMLGEGIRSVGTLDIGRISYAAPQLRILDLGGLTDRDIARSPGGFDSKQPSPALLERKAPDAFIFTTATPPEVRAPGEFPTARFDYPVERYVSELPWFRQHYVLAKMLPVESGLYFLWFQRLPPEGGVR